MVTFDRPVRLLLLSGSLGIGGTERYMHQLLQGLSRERFRVDIGLFDTSPTGYPGGVPDDVAVHQIPDSIPAGARAVRRLVRARDIELVHTCAFETSLMALGGTVGTGVRRAVGHHGLHGTYSARDRALRLLIDERAHAIYANSVAATERLPRRHADRTVIIYNGVDAGERSTLTPAASRANFAIPDGAGPVVGTVARLHSVKGQDRLIEAFAGVAEVHPAAVLVLVGDGPERMALERLAKELGLDDRVRFAGARAAAQDVMPALDVFALPSRLESFPQALLEAMLNGRASVASDIGGVRELVDDGRVCRLVPPDDAAALRAALLDLLADDEGRRKMGEAAAAHARSRFSIEGMIDGVDAMLMGAMTGRT